MGASKSRDATATSSGESILSDEGPASDRGIGRGGQPSRGAQSRPDASAGGTRMQAAPEQRQVNNAWPQSVQILADVDVDERNVQPPPELEEEWSATDSGGFVPESPGPACAGADAGSTDSQRRLRLILRREAGAGFGLEVRSAPHTLTPPTALSPSRLSVRQVSQTNVVVRVAAGSAAETGGVRVGDALYELDGVPLRVPLPSLARTLRLGATLELSIYRAGSARDDDQRARAPSKDSSLRSQHSDSVSM